MVLKEGGGEEEGEGEAVLKGVGKRRDRQKGEVGG